MRKKILQHIKSNSHIKLARSLSQRGRNLIKKTGVASMRSKYVK